MSDEHDADYELLLPFVVVTSRGGPYDDAAYVAGWEMGELRRDLAGLARTPAAWTMCRTIRSANVPQADLLAVEVGATLTVDRLADSPEWCTITVRSARL